MGLKAQSRISTPQRLYAQRQGNRSAWLHAGQLSYLQDCLHSNRRYRQGNMPTTPGPKMPRQEVVARSFSRGERGYGRRRAVRRDAGDRTHLGDSVRPTRRGTSPSRSLAVRLQLAVERDG